MDHDDLRKQAIEALTNYLHHKMFDSVPIPMLPFFRMHAEKTLNMFDMAMTEALAEGKKRGLI